MTQNRHTRSSERGSAIFFILIGVALFGALSYTVAGMLRTGKAETIPAEQAKIYASQILDYGNGVRQAVQNVLINGCDETEVSFTQTSGDSYEHSTPVPDRCKIFHRSGGGMNYVSPSDNINDGSEYIFTGRHAADNVGSVCSNASCSELIMVLENLDRQICLSINDRLDIDNPGNDAPNDAGGTLAVFTGTFDYGNVLLDEDSALDGKTAGCFRDTPGNTYSYFKILIAR